MMPSFAKTASNDLFHASALVNPYNKNDSNPNTSSSRNNSNDNDNDNDNNNNGPLNPPYTTSATTTAAFTMESVRNSVLAGYVAGVCGTMVGHPFDTVKVWMQTNHGMPNSVVVVPLSSLSTSASTRATTKLASATPTAPCSTYAAAGSAILNVAHQPQPPHVFLGDGF